jgi:hypothetical protein
MAHIKVIVDKNKWSIKIEGEGFTGRKCAQPLDAIQRLLGGTITKRIPKDTVSIKDKIILKG